MLEPTLLDELICHLASLASVYHRPIHSFVEGRYIARRQLPARGAAAGAASANATVKNVGQPSSTTVIPTKETLIGDLLDINFDGQPSYERDDSLMPESSSAAVPDLLGDGLDDLLPSIFKPVPGTSGAGAATAATTTSSTVDALADIFGVMGTGAGTDSVAASSSYEAPMVSWLEPTKGKGLEIRGTFVRQNGTILIKLMFTNHALSALSDFAIQFNKNSFGLSPAEPLTLASPLAPSQSVTTSLPLSVSGPVMKRDPLMELQVAVKNNVDVFYFTTSVPMHTLFKEDGTIEKLQFLATWKDIPTANEQQFALNDLSLSPEQCTQRLAQNNIFTVAKHNVSGQHMLHLAMRTSNNIFILAELMIQPNNTTYMLTLKSRVIDVYQPVYEAFVELLK